MSHAAAFQTFLDPPREFGPIPFWFWNDDLREEELLRQLHAFHDAGFGGVLPHPRTGLSRRVGYLTDEYFRLVRRVVEEAARLDMKIILYDEGSYPSGTAKGAVVAANPDFANQALGVWNRDIEGPFNGYWRPKTGRALLDKHVCTVVGRRNRDGSIDSTTLRTLAALENDIVHIDVPSGAWLVMSLWNTASGGHIRGVFPEEETGHATAPPAADILNPEAVDTFIELTHEAYYRHLKDFFGTTVIAFFTDEPSVLGKNPIRPVDSQPFTPGFVEWLSHRRGDDVRPWLPSLWHDFGEGTEEFRRFYAEAVQSRLREVFYTRLSQWCADHGIALTGHPSASNEVSALRFFQIPGQDLVWRTVTPGNASALEGSHSVAGKSATSGARMNGSQRVLTEVFGAYGWRLTLDEVKWLLDWHLVRGVNLISLHAVFYSIRGRRAWESEPDMGVHNAWWPHFHHVALYSRRLSWLLANGADPCCVAILGDGDDLPWQGAKLLFQAQIDFLYLDLQALNEARVEAGALHAGTQCYRVVVVEGDASLAEAARPKLDEFTASGGQVIRFEEGMDLPAALDRHLPRTIRLEPHNPDLRFTHYQKEGLDFLLLVNEGEAAIEGELQINLRGRLEAWDAFEGGRSPLKAEARGDGICVALTLDRRQSRVLVVDRQAPFEASEVPAFPTQTVTLTPRWTVTRPTGEAVEIQAPGDWSQAPGLELFTGTLHYLSSLTVPDKATHAWLDLGDVGDIAALYVDGREQGVRMWAPYRFSLGDNPGGTRQVQIRITNSMTNAYDGTQAPSGLLGPVRLVFRLDPAQGVTS